MQEQPTRRTTPQERVKAEQEALRRMWEIIAWTAALLSVSAWFFLPLSETKVLLILVFMGIAAFAIWKNHGRSGNATSEVAFRFNVLGVSGFLALFGLILLGLVVLPLLSGIISAFTDWLVK